LPLKILLGYGLATGGFPGRGWSALLNNPAGDSVWLATRTGGLFYSVADTGTNNRITSKKLKAANPIELWA